MTIDDCGDHLRGKSECGEAHAHDRDVCLFAIEHVCCTAPWQTVFQASYPTLFVTTRSSCEHHDLLGLKQKKDHGGKRVTFDLGTTALW